MRALERAGLARMESWSNVPRYLRKDSFGGWKASTFSRVSKVRKLKNSTRLDRPPSASVFRPPRRAAEAVSRSTSRWHVGTIQRRDVRPCRTPPNDVRFFCTMPSQKVHHRRMGVRRVERSCGYAKPGKSRCGTSIVRVVGGSPGTLSRHTVERRFRSIEANASNRDRAFVETSTFEHGEPRIE